MHAFAQNLLLAILKQMNSLLNELFYSQQLEMGRSSVFFIEVFAKSNNPPNPYCCLTLSC